MCVGKKLKNIAPNVRGYDLVALFEIIIVQKYDI
jgi:hypothetical protein